MPALIEHLVVLMLENRSFDNLLGWLYPGREDFDGLTGQEFNVWHQAGEESRIEVWNDSGMSRTTARGPDPDPGELFTDMQQQFWSSGPDIATPRQARHGRFCRQLYGSAAQSRWSAFRSTSDHAMFLTRASTGA
jgi:phospholipase C